MKFHSGSRGSEESISKAFIDAVQPLGVMVSVGAGNARDDPQPESLALLEGITILRTGEHGSIHLATGGVQLWVEAGRQWA
jgi:beta-lactamase superfamily II metal-dependent hydrolase